MKPSAGPQPPRRPYPSDLTDAEWQVIAPLLPAPKERGQPRIHSRREIIDAIRYVLRGGIAWRALPHDFPPWPTVWTCFRRWRDDGTWKRVHDALYRQARTAKGRDPEPSAGILDSQSVKTTEKGGTRGYDAGKQVKGRKRFLLVDTEGLLVGLWVDGADTQDRDGGYLVVQQAQREHPQLRHLWVDGAFAGEFVQWVRRALGWSVEVVGKLAGQKGFQVLPRRWVVERTFGWWNLQRRLSNDYEELEQSPEAWIYLTMIGVMARRLARSKSEPHTLLRSYLALPWWWRWGVTEKRLS